MFASSHAAKEIRNSNLSRTISNILMSFMVEYLQPVISFESSSLHGVMETGDYEGIAVHGHET